MSRHIDGHHPGGDPASRRERGEQDDGRDDGDEALGAVLRRAVPAPPVDEVDWTALHARISAAAAPRLKPARRPEPRKLPRAWWQPLAGWSPLGIPAAAAASVLLLLAAGAARQAAEPADTVAFRTVEEELAGGLSAGARLLLGDAGSGAVLDVALFAEGEDW